MDVNDKGLIFIYDISNRISSKLNDLSNFEWFVGTFEGQTYLIDNYIVCINSKNNFYSYEHKEYLNSKNNEEYDYSELFDRMIIYSEWLDDLCNTPDEELPIFIRKIKRIDK